MDFDQLQIKIGSITDLPTYQFIRNIQGVYCQTKVCFVMHYKSQGTALIWEVEWNDLTSCVLKRYNRKSNWLKQQFNRDSNSVHKNPCFSNSTGSWRGNEYKKFVFVWTCDIDCEKNSTTLDISETRNNINLDGTSSSYRSNYDNHRHVPDMHNKIHESLSLVFASSCQIWSGS